MSIEQNFQERCSLLSVMENNYYPDHGVCSPAHQYAAVALLQKAVQAQGVAQRTAARHAAATQLLRHHCCDAAATAAKALLPQ